MLAWSAVVSAGSNAPSRAGEPEPRQGASATFAAGTSRVLLDVVVRDRKGGLVRGLGAADFEVREDGARQVVDSFRAVETGMAAPAGGGVPDGASPRGEGDREPATLDTSTGGESVVVFVFDAMTASGREWAHQAALSYVDGGSALQEQAAVFAIEGGLRVVEPFTRDATRLRAAFDRVLQRGSASTPIDDRFETQQLVDDIDRAQVGLPKAGAGTNIKEAIGATAARSAVEQMQVRMSRTFERLERDEGGQASMNALLAVVNAIGGFRGRKALVLFSEGLLVPAGARAQFRSVVASANRANVSIYSLDAGGLRAESGTAETRSEIDQAAMRRMRQFNEGGGDAPDGDMMRQLERNEDLLRLNPGSGLGELAEATGGFLAQGTNDARAAFARIAEDVRSYYLLSYTPSNESYDGKFRTIDVKVRRPGLRVQARRGYFAVRPSNAFPVLADEAPALAALDQRRTPNAFPLGVAALTFPEPQRVGLVPVVVDTPLDGISCAAAGGKAHRCAVDFEVVVRIKDGDHKEVARMSQHYRFTSPAAGPPSGKRGSVLFYREAELPPGRYHVEAAGYDALAHAASVATTDLTVPEVGEGRLRLSSVVLVTHADPLDPGEAQAADILRFGDAVLYPSTGRPWSRSKSPTLAFFFVVYGADAAARPRALIEVRRGDQAVQTTTVDLPDPDATGRIRYAGTLPLAPLEGAYTLRVTVADTRGSDARAAPFTVVP